MVRFQCENEGCRLYHKEYEYGSDESNPGRCLSCRLPMAKFLSADMGEGFSLKARCADDRNKRARDFLDATSCVENGNCWGAPVVQMLNDASQLMDEQDIPLTGRAVFQPGVGVLYDPAERVVSLLEKNDQIDRSFLLMIRTAHSHKAYYVESKLRDLHHELSSIIRIEEGG